MKRRMGREDSAFRIQDSGLSRHNPRDREARLLQIRRNGRLSTPLRTQRGGVFGVFPLLACVLFGQTVLGSERFNISVPTKSPLNHIVLFDAYVPDAGSGSPRHVLLLVPGYNGNGAALLARDAGWTEFAEMEGVVLLAPTFKTNLDEIRQRQGYYHPEHWSGQAVFDALEELGQRASVKTEKIFLFGFSAGAHFAHRFALWRPDRAGAFVAYSAAWWDEPTMAVKDVPALIMCGEEDLRLNASLTFAQKGLALGCPWIWRSYEETRHEITPEVLEMARVFLRHYIRNDETHPVVGDIQDFRICAPEDAESLPAICRVVLPSKKIAEVWAQSPKTNVQSLKSDVKDLQTNE